MGYIAVGFPFNTNGANLFLLAHGMMDLSIPVVTFMEHLTYGHGHSLTFASVWALNVSMVGTFSHIAHGLGVPVMVAPHSMAKYVKRLRKYAKYMVLAMQM